MMSEEASDASDKGGGVSVFKIFLVFRISILKS